MTTASHITWRQWHAITYAVIVTVVLLLSALRADLSSRLQLGLLVVLVALLGVPHGALDPLVAYAAGMARSPAEMARFFGLYMLQAATMLITWWALPEVAFIAFLLMSIVHFSGDWKDTTPRWQCLAAAAIVVGGPPLFYPQETADIFAVLIPERGVPTIVTALRLLGILAIASLLLGSVRTRRTWRRRAGLLSLPVLAWALPPIPFFIVYFCGWHSPKHFLETLGQLSIRAHVVWGVTLALTLVTLLGAAVVFLIFRGEAADSRLLQIVFIGLAALTVPHMLLMRRAESSPAFRGQNRATARRKEADGGPTRRLNRA
jgi:Brp/Blh family beta-carotene 15,15'-monooxygenase